MADKLTPQQEQAVCNRGGMLLVSAAAGSGKTKVLVDRLLTYLTDENDPADLDEFLIITYTKAAASELRGKIAAKLTERIANEPENRHLQICFVSMPISWIFRQIFVLQMKMSAVRFVKPSFQTYWIELTNS